MFTFLMIVMLLLSIFMILLILVQKGKGGGLVGAFGGVGGQSAFGAKAGDTFTKITVVAATIWILTCTLALKIGPSGSEFKVSGTAADKRGGEGAKVEAPPQPPSEGAPAGGATENK